VKLLITGKFKKDSNKCACFSLPFEDSKEIDYNRAYLLEVTGPISGTKTIKYKKHERVLIKII